MLRALTEALTNYDHAILIGSDCPSLTTTDISEAIQALQNEYDVVIAPAEDGGYVLIGLNYPNEELFTSIPWSTGEVMAETRQRANFAGLRLHELRAQWDVDTVEDWRRFLSVQRPA